MRDLIQRVIERSNGRYQPQRLAQGVGATVLAIRGRVTGEDLSIVAQRLHGGKAEDVLRPPQLVTGVLQRQTRFERNQLGEVRFLSLQQVGDPVQDLGPLVPRQFEALLGGAVEDLADFRSRQSWRRADYLPGVGIADLELTRAPLLLAIDPGRKVMSRQRGDRAEAGIVNSLHSSTRSWISRFSTPARCRARHRSGRAGD